MGDDIKLRVSKIEKSFPGVKALDKIDFAVRKGTVHALCGENGAGKSTLMKIINGIYKPDAGEIFIDEKPVKIKDPIVARSLGIAMIAQELNFIPEMSVEENIFLGRLPVDGLGRVKWGEVRKKTEELLKNEHLPYKATEKLKMLTTSDIQMPLRYNYDKPEKPRRIKGFEVFSLVFSSFSKPKNHTEISRIIGGVSLTTNE